MNVTKIFGIEAENYIGCSFDGQYHHQSVPHHLNQLFGFDDTAKPADWDPMHKTGLVDTHIRKNKEFEWLNSITADIAQAFKLINFGKEYEHFIDVAEKLRVDSTFLDKVYSCVPLFYSKTKFANHCATVYEQFFKNYPALVCTLEETHDFLKDGTSREKEKSANAGRIRSKLISQQFVIRLCGICDIYNLFSDIVNLLQKVNILPHIKYEKFNLLILKLEDMCLTISDHYKCLKDQCNWPYLHGNHDSIVNDNIFRGISLCEPIIDKLTRSRTMTQYLSKNETLPAADQELEKLRSLAQNINKNLSLDVYGSNEKDVIKTLKQLCDIKGLKVNVDDRGIPLIYSITVEKFLKAAHKVSTNIENIPESQLSIQYKTYLETLSKTPRNLDSLDYLKLLVNSKKKLYINCELIIHIICTAAVYFSVESILESHVSQHEHKINLHRAGRIREERHSQELTVYINGPPVPQCLSIVQEAMNQYWHEKTFHTKTKEWHFTRTSQNVKNYTVSKVVDRHHKKISNLPFLSKEN